jgi:hypothetical protein
LVYCVNKNLATLPRIPPKVAFFFCCVCFSLKFVLSCFFYVVLICLLLPFVPAVNAAGEEIIPPSQGDQIGRNFAYLAIFYFGQFFDNYESSTNFC